MYYIYHIPGVKIGVSKEPKKRVRAQGYDSFEILETHDDPIIVGDREKELQKQYGYKVDQTHYSQVLQFQSKGASKIKGRPMTELQKQKLSLKMKGRVISEETKLKRSIARRGIPKPKLECPECGKLIGGQANLVQHLRKHQ